MPAAEGSLGYPHDGAPLPTVHGDARVPNVMVRVLEAAEGGGIIEVQVRFVDFDWAGIQWPGRGGARCPTLVNRKLFPPNGIVEGGPLSQALDAATLAYSATADGAAVM